MPENLLKSLLSPIPLDNFLASVRKNDRVQVFIMNRDGKLLGSDGSFRNEAGKTSLFNDTPAVEEEQVPYLVIDTAERKRMIDEAVRVSRPVMFETRHEPFVWYCHIYPLFTIEKQIDYCVLCVSKSSVMQESEKTEQMNLAASSGVYDAIPASIIMVDADLGLVGWNRFSRDTINGLSDNEMPGINPLKRVHPDDLEEISRKVLDIIHNDTEQTGEFRMFHRNTPAYKWAMFRGRRAVIQNKPCMVAVVTEITELREAEEKQKKLQEQLLHYQKMELVGQLAGGIAHDFNNALAAILGNTELALGKLDPSSPVISHINDIHKLALRSAEMTRQLLAFARKQMAIPKVFNFADAIRECIDLHCRLFEPNINVEWKPCGKQVMVKLDPTQLEQILSNLLINARDAITDSGEIRVACNSVSLEQADCDQAFSGLTPGNYVRLTVSDSGCGIDATVLPHIYEPFFTTKEIGKGTGLGLSTVYGIVMQNNGQIECTSEPGRGTTFEIWLPTHHDLPEPRESGKQSDITPNGKQTIMVVEDEPYILKLIADILESCEFTVLTARDAEEGLNKAAEHGHHIDLLVSDVVLPTMNGIEMSRLMRMNNPALKLLFMSAHAPENVSRQRKLRPGVDFIQKPFGINDFIEAVEQALRSTGEEVPTT